jgi:hypothetical protein
VRREGWVTWQGEMRLIILTRVRKPQGSLPTRTRSIAMTLSKEDLEQEIQNLEAELATLQQERKEAGKLLKYTTSQLHS